MKYVCHYQGVINKFGDLTVEGNSIYDFKDGFWIDEAGKLSNQISGKYWIPPSRIYYTEKVEKIEGD